MVVLNNTFVTQSAARQLIQGLGVSEVVLAATDEAHRDVDWRYLAEALDDVFLAYGGGMGQAMFLRERLPELEWLTPVEALPRSGGPERVRRAAVAFARRGE